MRDSLPEWRAGRIPRLAAVVWATDIRCFPAVIHEWDRAKAALNRRKHGIAFKDAVAALEDTLRLEALDPGSHDGEERTRVTRKAGDPPLPGDTDWARLDSMTDAEREAGAAADPDAPPLTDAQLAAMRRVSRVKRLRERLGLTQVEFAAAFRLPLSTLRDWEQRRSVPDAPARALLLAIERDPDAMRRPLAGAAA